MYSMVLLLLPLALSTAELSINPMRAARCVVPNGIEHVSRAAMFQQCLSKNYTQGNETQCYGELLPPCFPMSNPWTSLLRPFPSPLHPAEINVTLQCFTRNNPSQMYNIELWPDISLNGCPVDAKKKTVFITHGFATNGNFPWLAEFKDRYLHQVDANVFVVDWGQGAQLLSYLQVSSNTRIVGAEVSRFIKMLQDTHGLTADNLHLIGHSLGAQISSYIAKMIPGVDRLTALDPAQPGFEGADSQVRLDKTDAKFVEVVHTNAAPFLPALGYGMISPQGHVDFYINGGMHQPGCQKLATPPEIKGIKDLMNYSVESGQSNVLSKGVYMKISPGATVIYAIMQWVCCSHCRAFEFYMRVLQDNCIIWGRKSTFTENMLNAGTTGLTERLFTKTNKCTPETCIPLSLDTPKYKARGVFAATTSIKEPFCENDQEVNSKLLAEISEDNEQPDQEAASGVGGVVDKAKNIGSKIYGNFKIPKFGS